MGRLPWEFPKNPGRLPGATGRHPGGDFPVKPLQRRTERGYPPNRGLPMALNYSCLFSFITCFFIKNTIYLRLEKGDYTFPQFTSQDVFFETRDGFPKNGFRRSPERSAPNLTIFAGIILFFPPVRGRRGTPAVHPASGKKADPQSGPGISSLRSRDDPCAGSEKNEKNHKGSS